jgi:hypothetical protein
MRPKMTEGQEELFMLKKGVTLKVTPSKDTKIISKINKAFGRNNDKFWYTKHEGEYLRGYVAGEKFVVYEGVLKGGVIPMKDVMTGFAVSGTTVFISPTII